MAWYDRFLSGGEPDIAVYRSEDEIARAGYNHETTLDTRELFMWPWSVENAAARNYVTGYNQGRVPGQRVNAALISDRQTWGMRVSAIVTASRQTVRVRR